METLLEKYLRKLTWLNLSDAQLVAEFSAHLGWSLGYLFIAQRIFGEERLLTCAWVWVIYCVYKELIEDGHLIRRIKKQETPEETKDLVTDLLSRTILVLIVIALEYLKG